MFGAFAWETVLILILLFGGQFTLMRRFIAAQGEIEQVRIALRERVERLESKLEYLERHNDLLVAHKVDVRATIDG